MSAHLRSTLAFADGTAAVASLCCQYSSVAKPLQKPCNSLSRLLTGHKLQTSKYAPSSQCRLLCRHPCLSADPLTVPPQNHATFLFTCNPPVHMQPPTTTPVSADVCGILYHRGGFGTAIPVSFFMCAHLLMHPAGFSHWPSLCLSSQLTFGAAWALETWPRTRSFTSCTQRRGRWTRTNGVHLYWVLHNQSVHVLKVCLGNWCSVWERAVRLSVVPPGDQLCTELIYYDILSASWHLMRAG